MAKLNFQRQNLTAVLSRSLTATAQRLDIEFEQTIESNIFPWPGQTRRRNGETVGSPRDIVDTGKFQDSQSFSQLRPNIQRFLWDVDYSAIIFFGATLRNGGEIPGRDWIKATFDRVNPLDFFAEEVRKRNG